MTFHISAVAKYLYNGGVTREGCTSSTGRLENAYDFCWHFRYICVNYITEFISNESINLQSFTVTTTTVAKIQKQIK
jgi:hypothetical protein